MNPSGTNKPTSPQTSPPPQLSHKKSGMSSAKRQTSSIMALWHHPLPNSSGYFYDHRTLPTHRRDYRGTLHLLRGKRLCANSHPLPLSQWGRDTTNPDGSQPEREFYSDVILTQRLRAVLDRLNPTIPPAARDDTFNSNLLLKIPHRLSARAVAWAIAAACFAATTSGGAAVGSTKIE